MNADDSQPRQNKGRWKRQIRRGALYATIAAIGTGLWAATFEITQNRQAAALLFSEPRIDALPVVPADMKWGFALDMFGQSEHELRSGDVLGEILSARGMDHVSIHKLVENCKGIFNINSMRAGRKLVFLDGRDGNPGRYMIYEPSAFEYTVFDLQEPFLVRTVKREVETRISSASGVLETSFWQAMTDNGLSDELADGLIDVLASSVDFYHQRQGDRFKVMFEEKLVEGKTAGTGRILAALYEREGKTYYAIQFQKSDNKVDYFDFEGRPARKAFLKAPVRFSRISSRYNLNRLHPILGYKKAHFGTDYAAPYGTPIIAVADGYVLEATRRGGNGNFVKLRHDNLYETQYLHMQGFARGIRPGAHVSQGQVIGYVGSTGLATGPHVCFRFWKNGRQVDHLRLDLPSPQPMQGTDLERFKTIRDSIAHQLDGVPYLTKGSAALSVNTEDNP